MTWSDGYDWNLKVHFSRTKTAAMKAYGEFVKEGIGERNNPVEDVEAGVLLGSLE